MKHMKRIAALLTAALLLLALGACAPLQNAMGKLTSGGKEKPPYKSYKLEKYITLGEYKGLEADFVTEEGYPEYYAKDIFAQYGVPMGVVDDAAKTTVAMGDTVYFDYEGSAAGATADDLQGMKGKNIMVIGSLTFIEGFEEQMVGKPRGEEFTVNVKFPDPYNSETLAGKDAAFKCTVHKIGTAAEQISDEGVVLLTDGEYTTAADFLKMLTEDMAAELSEQVAQVNMGIALEAAFKNAEIIEIPAKEIEYWDAQILQDAERNQYPDVDTYAQQGRGYENAVAFREDQTKHELFVFAVADQEGITVEEEDLEEIRETIRTNGGGTGTGDELFDPYGGRGRIVRMLMMEKVSKFLCENAKNAPASAAAQG